MSFTSAATFFGIFLLGQQLPPPPTPIDPALRQEILQFQGSWRFESLEENGKKVDAKESNEWRLTFAGDNLLIRGPNKAYQVAVLKLGIAKNPKTLNATTVQGSDRGTTMLGIYAFDGDKLKICLDPEGEERPKDFTAPAEAKRKIMICKRVADKDQRELLGRYRSVCSFGDEQERFADADIERLGDGFSIQYKDQGNTYCTGVGLRNGNAMTVFWFNQGKPGITVYQIEPGPRLVGRYMLTDAPGIVADEILTRVDAKDGPPLPPPPKLKH